jgi:CRP-like cAMP-binding protein
MAAFHGTGSVLYLLDRPLKLGSTFVHTHHMIPSRRGLLDAVRGDEDEDSSMDDQLQQLMSKLDEGLRGDPEAVLADDDFQLIVDRAINGCASPDPSAVRRVDAEERQARGVIERQWRDVTNVALSRSECGEWAELHGRSYIHRAYTQHVKAIEAELRHFVEAARQYDSATAGAAAAALQHWIVPMELAKRVMIEKQEGVCRSTLRAITSTTDAGLAALLEASSVLQDRAHTEKLAYHAACAAAGDLLLDVAAAARRCLQQEAFERRRCDVQYQCVAQVRPRVVREWRLGHLALRRVHIFDLEAMARSATVEAQSVSREALHASLDRYFDSLRDGVYLAHKLRVIESDERAARESHIESAANAFSAAWLPMQRLTLQADEEHSRLVLARLHSDAVEAAVRFRDLNVFAVGCTDSRRYLEQLVCCEYDEVGSRLDRERNELRERIDISGSAVTHRASLFASDISAQAAVQDERDDDDKQVDSQPSCATGPIAGAFTPMPVQASEAQSETPASPPLAVVVLVPPAPTARNSLDDDELDENTTTTGSAAAAVVRLGDAPPPRSSSSAASSTTTPSTSTPSSAATEILVTEDCATRETTPTTHPGPLSRMDTAVGPLGRFDTTSSSHHQQSSSQHQRSLSQRLHSSPLMAGMALAHFAETPVQSPKEMSLRSDAGGDGSPLMGYMSVTHAPAFLSVTEAPASPVAVDRSVPQLQSLRSEEDAVAGFERRFAQNVDTLVARLQRVARTRQLAYDAHVKHQERMQKPQPKLRSSSSSQRLTKGGPLTMPSASRLTRSPLEWHPPLSQHASAQGFEPAPASSSTPRSSSAAESPATMAKLPPSRGLAAARASASMDMGSCSGRAMTNSSSATVGHVRVRQLWRVAQALRAKKRVIEPIGDDEAAEEEEMAEAPPQVVWMAARRKSAFVSATFMLDNAAGGGGSHRTSSASTANGKALSDSKAPSSSDSEDEDDNKGNENPLNSPASVTNKTLGVLESFTGAPTTKPQEPLRGLSERQPVIAFMDVAFAVCGVISCMIATFQVHPRGNEYKDSFTKMEYVVAYNAAVTVFSLLWMCSRLLLAQRPDKWHIIDDMPGIRKHYLKTWFFYDLLYALPYDFIFVVWNWEAYQWLQLRHFLRLPRIIVLGNSNNPLQMSRLWFRFMSFLLLMGLNMHVLGSIFWYLEDASTYTEALYWSVSSMTSVGYGDVLLTHQSTRIYACVAMLFGIIMLSTTTAFTTKFLTSSDKLSEDEASKKHTIYSMMKHYDVPWDVQKEVITAVPALLEKHYELEFRKITARLPQFIAEKVESYVRTKLLRTVPLFHGIRDTDALLDLSRRLEQRFFQTGEAIMEQGDSDRVMYFLLRGVVELIVLLDPDDVDGDGDYEATVVGTLHQGSWFGEDSLFRATDREVTAQAVSVVETLALTFESFAEFGRKHPTTYDSMRRRLERHEKAKAAAVEAAAVEAASLAMSSSAFHAFPSFTGTEQVFSKPAKAEAGNAANKHSDEDEHDAPADARANTVIAVGIVGPPYGHEDFNDDGGGAEDGRRLLEQEGNGAAPNPLDLARMHDIFDAI